MPPPFQVLEKLAELPTPQEILALRPSSKLQSRIEKLLVKNRDTGLDAIEEVEWQRYETVEPLLRVAKARALAKLQERVFTQSRSLGMKCFLQLSPS